MQVKLLEVLIMDTGEVLFLGKTLFFITKEQEQKYTQIKKIKTKKFKNTPLSLKYKTV